MIVEILRHFQFEQSLSLLISFTNTSTNYKGSYFADMLIQLNLETKDEKKNEKSIVKEQQNLVICINADMCQWTHLAKLISNGVHVERNKIQKIMNKNK